MSRILTCDLCGEPIELDRYDRAYRLFFGRRIKFKKWDCWAGETEVSKRTLDLHDDCETKIMRAAKDNMVRVGLRSFLDATFEALIASADSIMTKKYGNPDYNKPGPLRHSALMKEIVNVIDSIEKEHFFVELMEAKS